MARNDGDSTFEEKSQAEGHTSQNVRLTSTVRGGITGENRSCRTSPLTVGQGRAFAESISVTARLTPPEKSTVDVSKALMVASCIADVRHDSECRVTCEVSIV